MARAALQRVGEACAAVELSRVPAAPALIEKGGVVRAGEVVIRARSEVGGAERRAELFDVWCEFGGLVGRGGRSFSAQASAGGWRGQRETRIGTHGEERV